MSAILLVDDHILLLDALREYLTRSLDGVTVSTMVSLAECQAALVPACEFDLVIVDYKMPGSRGLATIRELVNNPADVPVAVMSGQATPSEVMAILRLGTAGFVNKTVTGTSVTHAVRLMLSGERYIPASVFAERPAHRTRAMLEVDAEPIPERELAVLSLLRQGRTNKEIGRELNLEEVTVKHYVHRLTKRLGVKNRVQVLMAALDLGLVD